MSNDRRLKAPTRLVLVGATALGLAAGSYGIASAAGGSGAAASTTTAAAPSAQHPWGGQRSDETLLTGDTAAKVKAAALAKVGDGAIIERVETDADGNAAYEAHLVKADGSRATVYVDKQFAVVGVDTR
jgi:hypothetical protein